MSIDLRFSKSAFGKQPNEESVAQLAGALTAEIQEELHPLILGKVEEIVGRLNSFGHSLREYYPPVPGDVSFRDGIGDTECDLRLAVDVVVSVGFRDTTTGDELFHEHTEKYPRSQG